MLGARNFLPGRLVVPAGGQDFSVPGTFAAPYGLEQVTIGGRGGTGNPGNPPQNPYVAGYNPGNDYYNPYYPASGGNYAGTNPPTPGNYAGTNSPTGGNYAGTNPTQWGTFTGVCVMFSYDTTNASYTPLYYGSCPGPTYITYTPYPYYESGIYNAPIPGNPYTNPVVPGFPYYNPPVPGNPYYNPYYPASGGNYAGTYPPDAYYNPYYPGNPGNPGTPVTVKGLTFPGGPGGNAGSPGSSGTYYPPAPIAVSLSESVPVTVPPGGIVEFDWS